VLADPVLAEIVRTKEKLITDTTGQLQHPLINRNQLLHSLPAVFGVKTGTTDSAGENLITAIRRNSREFVIVLLGSQMRYIETQQAIQWVDRNYRWEVKRVNE
jgi:serine-type D-Ala-D-Ala carboxypeptidase (penicillin-binding protein 5/6)